MSSLGPAIILVYTEKYNSTLAMGYKTPSGPESSPSTEPLNELLHLVEEFSKDIPIELIEPITNGIFNAATKGTPIAKIKEILAEVLSTIKELIKNAQNLELQKPEYPYSAWPQFLTTLTESFSDQYTSEERTQKISLMWKHCGGTIQRYTSEKSSGNNTRQQANRFDILETRDGSTGWYKIETGEPDYKPPEGQSAIIVPPEYPDKKEKK